MYKIGWRRRRTLVLGLDAEDMMALAGGQEKRFMATVPGIGSFQVVIIYGRTDEDLADRLVLEQLMPITGVRKAPEAAEA